MATASKAFRARAFDSNRSMTVYWGHELPDLSECSVGNRAVTQMPSGMEKEEEMESHLQDAILAQQASTSGVQVNHVIPTPKVDSVEEDRYHKTYHNRNKMNRVKYIKVHAWQALERDEPEYDYDTEDETWLADHTHVEPRILEKIFDTVESHSSETQIASEDSVINFHKSLDPSIVYEVYEYWLSKRTSAATTSGCIGVGGLIPRIRTECRKQDGQGAVNPYVAFRRRAEKMQTRKNRKNDEDSYEKILKLVHDMSKAQQLFDMTARREKQKLAIIDMEAEILAKRMEMADFGTSNTFNEISEKLRASSEDSTKPLSEINGTDENGKKKKRVRRKIADKDLVSKAWLKKNAENWNRPPSLFGPVAPAVTAKPVTKEVLLDGKYSFKRRRGCNYRAANISANVPTTSVAAASTSNSFVAPAPLSQTTSRDTVPPTPTALVPPSTSAPKSESSINCRFYETFLPDTSGNVRSIGFARRRVGRGGRVIFDRLPRERSMAPTFDPWVDACVSDNSKQYRFRVNSIGTEEETEELTPRSSYFARSDRVRFDDDKDMETEREWSSRYQASMWKDTEEEPPPPSEKFDDLTKQVPVIAQQDGFIGKPSLTDNDDSEVERMDIEGHEDEAQITVSSPKELEIDVVMNNGNGCDVEKEGAARRDDLRNEDELDMDVDDHHHHHHPSQQMAIGKVLLMNGGSGGGGGKLKPLQEHSPPLSGNGRADRAEPTPVPAKMCGTVSDSDEWREPSGSPSESNSSTEWGVYAQEQNAVVTYKQKLINDVDDEEEMQQPSLVRGTRDHSIKDSMSTVTILERSKQYLMTSTIGI
ncbi:unnamed protein product [Caenorhabditis brenneri]